MSGATIGIFLVQGDPKRLRTAKLRNWTIQAVAGPRSEFEGVIGRDESGRSGVYFLTGNDPESGRPALYMGEAENIRERIKAHLEKDFWNQIVHFTSKDDSLTKAHIRYLEGKLIEQARDEEFSSPSAAAAVIHGGHANGLTAWKNRDGKTLKEIESK
jgi:hypothetical protein